jgi:hypothetical protein
MLINSSNKYRTNSIEAIVVRERTWESGGIEIMFKTLTKSGGRDRE